MINLKERKQNRRGFTLAEMVTTVAIVGTLTAIAIPNYLRIKMNVNMEMVKQHLRTIGTHMNELYNQNKQFPQDILALGNSGEEVSITSSLTAIDGKEYTRDGYVTYSNRSTYTFRTCPKEGRWGIAGDKCFLLDPSGVQELSLFSGVGLPMYDYMYDAGFAFGFQKLLQGTTTQEQKINFLTNLFEYNALTANYLSSSNPPPYGETPSSFLFVRTENRETFEQFLPAVLERLAERGIHIYQTSLIPTFTGNLFSTGSIVQFNFGATLDTLVNTAEDYKARTSGEILNAARINRSLNPLSKTLLGSIFYGTRQSDGSYTSPIISSPTLQIDH